MLTITKQVTLTGESRINGAVAEGYRAEISTLNPEDMTVTSWQVDKVAYKANRASCYADRAAFEDAAYGLQEEIVAGGKAEGTK